VRTNSRLALTSSQKKKSPLYLFCDSTSACPDQAAADYIFNLSCITQRDWNHLLFLACSLKDFPTARFLLTRLDINATDTVRSPHRFSALFHHLVGSKLLSAFGVCKRGEGHSQVSVGSGSRCISQKQCPQLLSPSAHHRQNGLTPLHEACISDHDKIAALLLEEGVGPNLTDLVLVLGSLYLLNDCAARLAILPSIPQ
jgi:hypothetical protein